MIVLVDGVPQPAATPVGGPLAANLDAAGNKITNLGAASSANDSARNGDVVHNTGNETVAGIKTFSSAFKIATYTVATLPANAVRQVAYASDGRKVGEGSGSGTGTLVYNDGTAWRRVGDDTTVVA